MNQTPFRAEDLSEAKLCACGCGEQLPPRRPDGAGRPRSFLSPKCRRRWLTNNGPKRRMRGAVARARQFEATLAKALERVRLTIAELEADLAEREDA
jgi:hypothetical protein